ncbi:MAG: helix-turn-helix domain-containing protein [bacterium]|nr:helix-turn-helix domain-containing protein [bacterium]
MTLQSLELISADELGELLSVPKATLYAWRYRGDGPPSMRIGRHLRYRPADVDEWLTSRVQTGDGS